MSESNKEIIRIDHLDLATTIIKKIFEENKFPTKGNVLEVGAGREPTRLKKELEDLGLEWIGVDPKTNHPQIIKGVMEDLPFADNSFMYLVACHSLEHSLNPILALKEMKRVTKPGGVVFIIGPYPCEEQLFGMDKEHSFVLNEKQLALLMKHAGFFLLNSKVWKPNDQEIWWQVFATGTV